ncbi:SAM-dependent methyltransferase, partial [Actinomadura adrarensis]
MTIASDYQHDVADYWNAERNAVNLRLGDVSGIYHHHYGIGAVDRSVLDVPDEARREEAIIAELHRLENAQARFLLDHLGDIRPEHRLLD